MEREDLKNIEGDGFVSSLYYLLWLKDKVLEERSKFMIADTIIFKFDAPIVWFFSDKHGQVKKKHKNKLTFHCIEECFLKVENKSDIVAVYIENNSAINQLDCQYLDRQSF